MSGHRNSASSISLSGTPGPGGHAPPGDFRAPPPPGLSSNSEGRSAAAAISISAFDAQRIGLGNGGAAALKGANVSAEERMANSSLGRLRRWAGQVDCAAQLRTGPLPGARTVSRRSSTAIARVPPATAGVSSQRGSRSISIGT